MTKFISIAKRFLKAFLAGFFSVVAVAYIAQFQSIGTWADLGSAIQTLTLAGTVGGLGGVFLAAEKWFNWTDQPK